MYLRFSNALANVQLCKYNFLSIFLYIRCIFTILINSKPSIIIGLIQKKKTLENETPSLLKYVTEKTS